MRKFSGLTLFAVTTLCILVSPLAPVSAAATPLTTVRIVFGYTPTALVQARGAEGVRNYISNLVTATNNSLASRGVNITLDLAGTIAVGPETSSNCENLYRLFTAEDSAWEDLVAEQNHLAADLVYVVRGGANCAGQSTSLDSYGVFSVSCGAQDFMSFLQTNFGVSDSNAAVATMNLNRQHIADLRPLPSWRVSSVVQGGNSYLNALVNTPEGGPYPQNGFHLYRKGPGDRDFYWMDYRTSDAAGALSFPVANAGTYMIRSAVDRAVHSIEVEDPGKMLLSLGSDNHPSSPTLTATLLGANGTPSANQEISLLYYPLNRMPWDATRKAIKKSNGSGNAQFTLTEPGHYRVAIEDPNITYRLAYLTYSNIVDFYGDAKLSANLSWESRQVHLARLTATLQSARAPQIVGAPVELWYRSTQDAPAVQVGLNHTGYGSDVYFLVSDAGYYFAKHAALPLTSEERYLAPAPTASPTPTPSPLLQHPTPLPTTVFTPTPLALPTESPQEQPELRPPTQAATPTPRAGTRPKKCEARKNTGPSRSARSKKQKCRHRRTS